MTPVQKEKVKKELRKQKLEQIPISFGSVIEQKKQELLEEAKPAPSREKVVLPEENNTFTFIDKEFWESNVKFKDLYSTQRILKSRESTVEWKLDYDEFRPGVKYEYIPLCSINLFLDGSIPFDLFGSGKEELFNKIISLSMGTVVITKFMHKFISSCIDKGKYNILFLLNESDLTITDKNSLKGRLIDRFTVAVIKDKFDFKPHRVCSFDNLVGVSLLHIDPQDYLNLETRGLTNCWKLYSSTISNLFLLYDNVNTMLLYSMVVMRQDIQLIKAQILSGTPISADRLKLVINPVYKTAITGHLKQYLVDRKIEVTYDEAIYKSIFEPKKLPVFQSTETKKIWLEGFISEFDKAEKIRLGIPIPKPRFLDEKGVPLGTAEPTMEELKQKYDVSTEGSPVTLSYGANW